MWWYATIVCFVCILSPIPCFAEQLLDQVSWQGRVVVKPKVTKGRHLNLERHIPHLQKVCTKYLGKIQSVAPFSIILEREQKCHKSDVPTSAKNGSLRHQKCQYLGVEGSSGTRTGLQGIGVAFAIFPNQIGECLTRYDPLD